MTESRVWDGSAADADSIVQWINAHGGDAEYDRVRPGVPNEQWEFSMLPARIRVRCGPGWAHVLPGDAVQCEELPTTFPCGNSKAWRRGRANQRQIRAFSVVPAATREEQP